MGGKVGRERRRGGVGRGGGGGAPSLRAHLPAARLDERVRLRQEEGDGRGACHTRELLSRTLRAPATTFPARCGAALISAFGRMARTEAHEEDREAARPLRVGAHVAEADGGRGHNHKIPADDTICGVWRHRRSMTHGRDAADAEARRRYAQRVLVAQRRVRHAVVVALVHAQRVRELACHASHERVESRRCVVQRFGSPLPRRR